MTVDRVVKIVESEKCGLDMSSYEDLHSSDVGGTINGDDHVSGDCNGDGKDDYVFVNDADVAPSNDRVENHAKLSLDGDDTVKINVDDSDAVSSNDHAKLSVDGDDNVKVNVDDTDVSSSNDHVENHAELSVDGVDSVKVDVDELSNDHVENHAKLSVDGDDNVKVGVDDSDLALSNDRVGNSENKEVLDAKLRVDGDNNVKVNADDSDVALSNDHVGNSENEEVFEAKLSVDGEDNVKVNVNVVDSDVALSTDRAVISENEEVSEAILSVDGDDNVKNDVNVDEEKSKVKKEVNLVEENREIKSRSEGVVVDSEAGISSGVLTVNEDSVPESVVDVVKESNDPKVVEDEVKEAETVFESGENENGDAAVASRDFDVDDNCKSSVYDGPEVAEAKLDESVDENGAVADVSEPTSEVVSGTHNAVSEEERHVVLPPKVGTETPASELERNVTENNSDVHGVDVPVTELESGDIISVESKSEPLETDVTDRSVATAEEHSSESRQHDLVSADGEGEKLELNEADDKIEQQGDLGPLAGEESREFVVSEVAVSELDESVITDRNGSNSGDAPGEAKDVESLSNQSEGARNAPEVENRAAIVTRESDEREVVPTHGVEESGTALAADTQHGATDKSALEDLSERVNGEGVGESEVTDETGENQEGSPEEGVVHDQVAEKTRSFSTDENFTSEDTTNLSEQQSAGQTESFDVVEEKISSEDLSFKNNLTSEDRTNLSELQSADNTAVNVDQNDEGGSHSNNNDVSENRDVPASVESSEDTGNYLRSEDEYMKLDSVDNLNEEEVVGDISIAADNPPNGSADDASSQTKLETENTDTKSESDAGKSEIEVEIKSNNVPDETVKPTISFGSFGGNVMNTSSSISTTNREALLHSAVNGDHSDGSVHDTASAKIAQPEQIDDVSASSAEGSEIETSEVQNINPDSTRRPFSWLVKVPRFDEGKYKDQLRQGEIELAEKTKTRDAFQAEFNKQQAYCRELKSNRDSANSEVKAARELVWAKTREIDSAHSLINLARHAVTVEDIDNKIHNLEHTLQHQTLNNLKEEKELVREIKQLNLQRQKLSANPQRQQEVQQALNQRSETEEQLKVLKKELDALRDNLSKADERFRAAKKKHEDEITLLNDLKQQLKSADDIRQEAYAHLKTIQKQLNEKNAPFYKAKNDLRVAYNYATAGKRDSLERHCVNQVEKLMEMWNKNDEFRKEYIQCNMRRTVWKFGTLDGTRLGINEVPPSLGNVSDNRVKTPTKVDSATASLTMERDFPAIAKTSEDNSSKKVEQKKTPPVKKVEAVSKNSLDKEPVIIEIEEVIEEPKLTKEEEELARKAEQLRKEEEAARLREQRRLEEKAKAEEALERKRRNALKAQARAEFKAQKEAEEKEKEREKRAKKKGKKKGIIPETTESEPAQPSELSSKSVKEPEVPEKPARTTKKTQKVSLHAKPIKTTKPIPPALRSKGKRGLLLRYWPYACVVLLAIALFYLGSYERIQAIKQLISGLLH